MDYLTYLQNVERLDVSRMLKQGLKERSEILWYRQPPDLNKIAQYWFGSILRSKRIIVYGAGTFAEKLLAILDVDGHASEIFAFVDSDIGKSNFSTFPRRVYSVDALENLEFDCLVVMHPFAEDKMEQSALLVGCSPEKIIRVFSSSEYRQWEREQQNARVKNSLTTYRSLMSNRKESIAK